MNKYFKGVLVVGLAVICVAVFYFLYKAGKPKQAPVVLENNEVKSAGISDEELKEKIGQMIMIGFRGTEAQEGSDIYNVIKDVKIGGVVMFDYDTPSKTYNRNIASLAQTQKLIADIQKYSKTPLFVAVDAEGGNVNRLKPKYGFSAVVSEEAMGKDKTLNTTRKESEKKATELKTAGFN
ncbi:MAG: hypothetical protein NTV36_02120, partial [Candidatus Staskawiczbacteria bacterium]|nr:hypothetical protein [Candidatus Staskawiczbacteria bacterium]